MNKKSLEFDSKYTFQISRKSDEREVMRSTFVFMFSRYINST